MREKRRKPTLPASEPAPMEAEESSKRRSVQLKTELVVRWCAGRGLMGSPGGPGLGARALEVETRLSGGRSLGIEDAE